MKHFSKLLICLLLSFQAFAQAPKNDIILQVNGDELTGKVTEITDDAVKFMYAGETLNYTIKKADIIKITYGSGRIEVYNKPSLSSARGNQAPASGGGSNGDLSDHHNKIAVLPFAFIRDGNKAADELSNIVQAACYSYLSKHAGVLTVLDTRNTNAKLLKAGVNSSNIDSYTMDDICNILGVEFLVDGTVQLNKVSQQNLASSTYSDKSKNTRTDSKSTGYASSSSTNYENYETTINVEIYNDKGNNMFSQSRKSFFKTQDAYQNALEYVLKRSPLYSK